MEIWKSDGNNELVGGGDWNMIFIVPYMLVMSLSQLASICFRGLKIPPTSHGDLVDVW